MKLSPDLSSWDNTLHTHPRPKRRGQAEGVWLGTQPLAKLPAPQQLWGCLRLSAAWLPPWGRSWRGGVGSSPQGVPRPARPATASVECLPPLLLLLTTSPSASSCLAVITEWSFPRWCYSNDHNTCPHSWGLWMGSQPSRHPGWSGWNTDKSSAFPRSGPAGRLPATTLCLWGPSWSQETVFRPLSSHVVLAGTVVLEEAKCKTLATGI